MRYVLFLLLVASLPSFGQALRDINYSYQYDPDQPFLFAAKPVRTTTGWEVHFEMIMQDSAQRADQYLIQWEVRGSIDEKQGTAIEASSVSRNLVGVNLEGIVRVPLSENPQYLTARVLNNAVKRVWFFYRPLLPNYPSNGFPSMKDKPVLHPYFKINTPVVLTGPGTGQYHVAFYEDDFPAAVPAFSEGMGRVSRGMKVDSAYNVTVNASTTFNKLGLYLVQADTTSKEGFAFRVEQDYPRLSRVESLGDPLIYICTQQEFARVKEAKGDKKAFDRSILAITGSTARAKDFIRNYYKRVEWANQYFTSYKEGWKTDRGMIYILFGLPDELYKFTDREVWNYSNANFKLSFNFVKSPTLFDPENYVLVRDKKFQDAWYDKVDLWRNARF